MLPYHQPVLNCQLMPGSTQQLPPLRKGPIPEHQRQITGNDKRNSKLSPYTFITQLLQAQVLLLPFTVDHLGAIGPFAQSPLYGHNCFINPFSDSQFDNLPAFAQTAYKQALAAPSGMPPKAARAIKPMSSPEEPNLQRRSTFTLQQWAQHTLGINISYSIAQHIKRALHSLSYPKPKARKLHCRLVPFHLATKPHVIDPLPHFHRCTAD